MVDGTVDGSVSSPHSQPVGASSSRFTHRHLRLLGQSCGKGPLRVIALIDFDAFYAQCEVVRLGLSPDQPLAVQQWNAIIALNYPAREYGLKRGISVDEAKLLCPQLRLQHVATWRNGESSWAYRSDFQRHMNTDKAALDPYRIESRKAVALVVKNLPRSPEPRVEKASVDEMFIDLSAHVHRILLDRHPILTVPTGQLDEEHLPLPPAIELGWGADHVIGDQESTTDWDDVALAVGADIVRRLRQTIHDELHYTTSAGIASNKMLAKLAAGHRRPHQQTIVRLCGAPQLLSSCPYKKIRGMGGQLGSRVQESFGGTTVADLLPVSLEDLKNRIGVVQGSWVFRLIRGLEDAKVVSRTHVQSMLAQKTFVPSLTGLDQASMWLRIFAAELYDRVLELDTPSSHRRPKTLTVYHHPRGRFGPSYSKQATFTPGSIFGKDIILRMSMTQLRDLTSGKQSWPCAAIGVRVSNLVEVDVESRSIKSFFSAKSYHTAADSSDLNNIHRNSSNVPQVLETNPTSSKNADRQTNTASEGKPTSSPQASNHSRSLPSTPGFVGLYRCPHCASDISASEVLEHLDWHVATKLQAIEAEAI